MALSRDLEKTLGRSGQSAESPPGSDVLQSDNVGELRKGGDFRNTAIPAAQAGVRKDERQGDPYAKPPLMTRVYEVSPPGGSGGEIVGDLEALAHFQIHTIMVDNPTTLWCYIPSAQRFIPPNTVGWVIPQLTGSPKLAIRWLAPGGHAQPAPVAAQAASIRGTEQYLPFSPGVASPVG